MKKIVIGYDGSEEAKDALRLAADLNKATGAELVVSAIDEIEPYWGDLNLEQLNESRQDYFQRMFAEAADQLGDSSFKRVVGTGSAPAALEQIAKTEDPDVIIVGSTHRAGMAKVLPGSTGARLLSGSPCAIAVAPKGYAKSSDGEIRHLGIAYDGQHEADLALGVAIDLARAVAGDLRLIAVNQNPSQISAGQVGALRDYYSEKLAAGVATVPEGIGSSSAMLEGDAAEELAKEGENLDLIVIGSRGYGPVRRVLLGGLAHKLMKEATCPVLVVPRGVEETPPKAESHTVDEIVL